MKETLTGRSTKGIDYEYKKMILGTCTIRSQSLQNIGNVLHNNAVVETDILGQLAVR